jgi:hypothetical protein
MENYKLNKKASALVPSPLAGESEVLGELASRRNSREGYLAKREMINE